MRARTAPLLSFQDLTRGRLHLSNPQVPDHLPPRNPRRLPQGREIQRTRQSIGEPKEEHGRDPATSILERKATTIRHLVLLHVAPTQVVHAAPRVDFGFVGSGDVGRLRAEEDVEVVVCGVAAGVSFGADSGSCKC